MNKAINYIKAKPKRSAAAILGITGALFTLLEQTGWALLSSEQHQAIINFLGAVFSFL